jgi:hypothetical protein
VESREHGDEILDSVKDEEFPEKLRNYLLLKDHSAQWNLFGVLVMPVLTACPILASQNLVKSFKITCPYSLVKVR